MADRGTPTPRPVPDLMAALQRSFAPCPYVVEVSRDTYVGCRLVAGHKGPCAPSRKGSLRA